MRSTEFWRNHVKYFFANIMQEHFQCLRLDKISSTAMESDLSSAIIECEMSVISFYIFLFNSIRFKDCGAVARMSVHALLKPFIALGVSR